MAWRIPCSTFVRFAAVLRLRRQQLDQHHHPTARSSGHRGEPMFIYWPSYSECAEGQRWQLLKARLFYYNP